jgi:hypothetical protein
MDYESSNTQKYQADAILIQLEEAKAEGCNERRNWQGNKIVTIGRMGSFIE